ncbi:metabolite traffic protein EboE [Algibacillus agarilyticus]|uniref:metabolite traffic protein EboE n=1 Tax=Algibacillus agarilyticus TaxID=2234133 RepID=UPI000DCF8620|nr:metabolite traffic protein EboE [Algibacillus agarilyticus]
MQWLADEIAYCANVHPGITAAEIESNIKAITREVREHTQLASLNAGLWLCEAAAIEYMQPDALLRLKNTLADSGLKAVTLNGFPQHNFHQPVVKEAVYLPTWAQAARLDYTQQLATLLAQLLPDDEVEGTISTLPLGYRHHWTPELTHQACLKLVQYCLHAAHLEQQCGKRIRLCLEMEPGCVLETTDQVIALFHQDLPRACKEMDVDTVLLSRYLGLCFDVCHQAVMQEDIADVLARINAADIIIGKVQVSAALIAPEPDKMLTTLQHFAEPKYLHQVTTYNQQGELIFCDDLSIALADAYFPREAPWFIHYHVPIQSSDVVAREANETSDPSECVLINTCSAIQTFFSAISLFSHKPHIEIETYTWHVLPDQLRPKTNDDLITGLSREHAWLANVLNDLDLLAPSKHKK